MSLFISQIQNGRARRRSCALAVGLIFVVAASMTRAADGDLDPTFGNGGKVVTDFNNTIDELSRMAVQPDGKIVAIGSTRTTNTSNKYALARYNPDGTLDSTFGTGGKVTTVLANVLENANAILLLPDGKILIGDSIALPTTVDSSWAFLRYNTNGTLDTSFGNNGIVKTNIAPSYDSIGHLAFQADGKIVAAGNTSIVRPPGEERNGDVVNSGDALQTRNRSGQATDASNWRSDVNGDGVINSGDVTLVRGKSGNRVSP